MSVSDFFSSFADKAQNAINQTPLAGHIHTGDSSGNHAPSQGGYRSSALGSIQHQIRSIGQQYTATTPLQRIITLEKSVALDFDALSKDGKTQSKELYTWGQAEDADLTDVTDRLAYLNFVHGSMSATLAGKLDSARAQLKALRDAEAAIVPKRNIRAGLRNQIVRLEHSQEKGTERRIAELKEQLARAESNDEHLEKELELLKRKAIRESEQKKWEAIFEYGEKLVLISQAATPIIGALPTLPPTTANPYAGAEVTAAARASLQHALDNYKPGQDNLDIPIRGDLSRSDTRSFGESHASELSSSAGQDSHPGLPLTPPIPERALTGEEQHTAPLSTQVPANPAQPVSAVVQDTSPSGAGAPAQSPSEDLYATTPVKTESAEEVKREAVAAVTVAPATEVDTGRESAEEEKKRLEREERERVLAAGATSTMSEYTGEKDGDELPPYKELQE
ncbi:hypothetical protein OG21DRAFT_1502699 [Imleria badia]|jgi:hypothetical protein|nr:hypothetical protein OG21DRAFT_1502699 [Imleria badia]